MIRRIATPFALALTLAACQGREAAVAGPRADYRMSLAAVGDTAWYHLQNEARIGVVNDPADTMVVMTSEDYVLELARTSSDTVVAFFDHIRIMVNRAGRIIPVPMEPLYRQEFVLTDSAGRLGVRAMPFVSQMEPSVRETARLLDEMFFTVPTVRLDAGYVWVDTVDATHELSGARYRRGNVTRYEVVGDTVLHGVQAKVIRYESALDNMAMQMDNDSARTMLAGSESGTIVYSPARRLLLARHRRGRLTGEMVMPTQTGFEHLPHFYDFAVTVELLPPGAEPPAAAPAPTAQPARRAD